MILTAFYTANLTAFLTLSRFTLPIEKVEDIAKLSNTWFAMEGGPVEYSVLVSVIMIVANIIISYNVIIRQPYILSA